MSDVLKKDKIIKLSIVAQPPKPQPPKPQPPKPQPPKPQPPKPQPPKPQPPKPQPPKPQPPKPQPPKPQPHKPQPHKPQPHKPQPPTPQPPKPQLAAPKPTAPQVDPSLKAEFLKMLLTRVTKNKHYPPRAEEFGITGNVVVEYVLNRSGMVLSATISRSSGNNMLDRASLKAVRTAHFDAWPDKIFPGDINKKFSVKIEFNIEE